jgi:hypothetical protein
VHGEQCFRPVEVPVGQVDPALIKPVTPPHPVTTASAAKEVPMKPGKAGEPMMAAVSGHRPCGKVYAEIQATCGRDVHRLRNLGLSYFKDTHAAVADAPKRLRPGPPRAQHTHTKKEGFDWRQRVPRYVDPARIPHEMGGHGKELFDMELRALISPRIVPSRTLPQAGGPLPEQFSWSSRNATGEPLDTTDSGQNSHKTLPPLQQGPSLSKWRQEGGTDWATSVMSELAREADWATREPSTALPAGLSSQWGSTSFTDPAGWPPPASSTMENETTTLHGSETAVHGSGLSTEYGGIESAVDMALSSGLAAETDPPMA